MTVNVSSTKDSLAAHYVSLATHCSVHTASPGNTGANEVAGGNPAYARRPITWNKDAAVAGKYVSDPMTFDLPAGSYPFLGLWSALAGGTFRDFKDVTATLSGQGTLRVVLTYIQD